MLGVRWILHDGKAEVSSNVFQIGCGPFMIKAIQIWINIACNEHRATSFIIIKCLNVPIIFVHLNPTFVPLKATYR